MTYDYVIEYKNHKIECKRIPETPVEGKPLGRHVRHDSRNKSYAAEESDLATLVKVDWTDTVLLDQGAVGSCTGNAATGNLGTGEFVGTTPAGTTLDENLAVALYSDAETIDGDGPYPPNDNGSSGPSVAQACLNRKLISGYTHALSLNAALTALQRQPVITGVNWYQGFDSPDANGFVSISGTVRGGHEFVVVGYDPATQHVKARNSWGPTFGVDGYFYFSSADWTRLLSEQGDVTIFTPLTKPAPVPTPVPTPTPTPSLPAPTLGAPDGHHINWTTVAGASRYHVMLNGVGLQDTLATEVAVTRPGTYTVAAYDSHGHLSPNVSNAVKMNPTPGGPTPSYDQYDSLLWSQVSGWASGFHILGNRTAAKDVKAWANNKNLA